MKTFVNFFQTRNTMRMKTNRSGTFVAIILSLVITMVAYVCTAHRKHPDDLLKVETIPFKTKEGWGYDIKVDGKIFIHQECIPAIAGNQSFESSADAEKTGNAVVKKLRSGKLPALTSEEVIALGVNAAP